MHKINRFIILPTVAGLVMASLACGGATPTSQPARIRTATSGSGVVQQQPPADTPVVEPTQPPAEDLYLGDAVQRSGYALAVLQVADPAEPGMFYEAEAGKKLVAVEVVVSNISGDSLSVNSLNFVMVDTEGYLYDPEIASVDNELALVDLEPGEQVRGWTSFKISESATASALKYKLDLFSSESLQASLALPPAGHTPVTLSLTPRDPPSALGDAVEQFDYSLTPVTVEDPATPGFLYTAVPGYKLIAIEVILANVSGTEALSANPLYCYLVDENGFVYEAELGGRDGQLDALDLAVGEKVRGWISFVIPEDAAPAYIKYEAGLFSGHFLVAGIAE